MLPTRPWTRPLATLALSGLAACGAAPLVERSTSPLGELALVPAGIDSTLDELRAAQPPLLQGDQLTFELALVEEGSSALHYLVLTVAEPTVKDGQRQFSSFNVTLDGHSKKLQSPLHEVDLELFDAVGAAEEDSRVRLGEGVVQDHVAACLAYEALEQLVLPDAVEGLEEAAIQDAVKAAAAPFMEALTLSTQSLVSLFGLAQDDDLLADLLWSVVDKPNLLSLVLSLGVDVALRAEFESAERVPDEDSPAPAFPGLWRLPVSLWINEQLALELDLFVTRPAPPLAVTGGIVALEGRHPTRDVTLFARLVGSRAGQEP
ncbi:MAG: hypothetical protein P1V81_06970 [Planctomycetota bacterium]|nr:hypothetical protein [Planctomycetota bacterium]